MAQEEQNELGAIMAAQNELAGINAQRAQNLQAEQAFLQQQQAASNTMMQAAQIGGGDLAQNQVGNEGLQQQVDSMNPTTQALLSQYGINSIPSKPSSTSNTSRITQSPGNFKIENITTNKNDIKIVYPTIPMKTNEGDGNASQAKFQTWLSNTFARQGQEYEVQKRLFTRRERDLEKQSNKMMRELEKSNKSFSERLDPKKWKTEQDDHMKLILTMIMLKIAPLLVEPIAKFTDTVKDTFQSVFGNGGKDGGPSFIRNIKEALGFDKDQNLFHSFVDLLANQLSILQEKAEARFQERTKLVKNLEQPKHSIIRDTSGWVTYLTNVMTTLFAGAEGAKKAAAEESKEDVINSLAYGESSFDDSADRRDPSKALSYYSDNFKGSLSTKIGDIITKEGKIQGGQESHARVAARATEILTAKSSTLNTGELSMIMSSLFDEARKKGMINIGKEKEARAFIESFKGKWDEMIKNNQIQLLTEKIIFYRTGDVEYGQTANMSIGFGMSGSTYSVDKVGIKFVSKESNETTPDDLVKLGFKDEIVSSYYLTKEGLKALQDNIKAKYGLDKLDFSDPGNSFTSLDMLQRDTRKELHDIQTFENTKVDKEAMDKIQKIEGIEKETEEKIKEIDSRPGAVNDLKQAREDRKKIKEHQGKVVVTSKFGVKRSSGVHGGIDVDLEKGTKVYSTGDGIISRVSEDERSGKYVKILHPDDTETLYCHLDKNDYFKEGDEVKEGDLIGLGGNTGCCRSTTGGDGSHLHYEVRVKGKDGKFKKIDPAKSLKYSHVKALIPLEKDEEEIKNPEKYEISALELEQTPQIEEVFETNDKGEKTLTAVKQKIGAYEVNYDPVRAANNPNSRPSENISSVLLNGTAIDINSREYSDLKERIDTMFSNKSYPGIYSISDKNMIVHKTLDNGTYTNEWIDLGEFSWNNKELNQMIPSASLQIKELGNKVWFSYSLNKMGELLQIKLETSLITHKLNSASNQYFETGNIIWSWAGFTKDAYEIFYPLQVPTNIGNYNPAFFSMGVLIPETAQKTLSVQLHAITNDANDSVRHYTINSDGTRELTGYGEILLGQGIIAANTKNPIKGVEYTDFNYTPGGKFIYDSRNTARSSYNSLVSGEYDYIRNSAGGNTDTRRGINFPDISVAPDGVVQLVEKAETIGQKIVDLGKGTVEAAEKGWYEGQGTPWKISPPTPITPTESTSPISTMDEKALRETFEEWKAQYSSDVSSPYIDGRDQRVITVNNSTFVVSSNPDQKTYE